jgi:hypothetical protein
LGPLTNLWSLFVVGLLTGWVAAAEPPAGFDTQSRSGGRSSAGTRADPGPAQTLRLLQSPRVHSVSDTSANIEWMASLPATCELAWGETFECENRITFDFIIFGSFSLTDLKPGATYYFQLRWIKLPEAPGQRGAAVQNLSDSPLKFTTLTSPTTPRTYHVAPDGNDGHSGLEPSQAFRTLQHAADTVNAGDTVHIAAGRYRESVRIRATGTPDRPITFRGVPGEPAIIDGDGMALHQGVISAAKSHLRFDGLYFTGHNRVRPPREFYWHPERPGDFNLYRGSDIVITRCLTDVDGQTSAPFILAWMIDQLVVRNCVIFSKMSGIDLYDCPDLRLEHNVFVSPQITAFDLQNRDYILKEKMALKALVARNVFTDNLYKKASLNIGIYNHSDDAVRWDSNCFLLRSIRTGHNRMTMPQFKLFHESTGSIFGDPGLSGPAALGELVLKGSRGEAAIESRHARLVQAVRERFESHGDLPPWWFTPDFLMNRNLGIEMEFSSFFTTHPGAQQAGIGLERDAFAGNGVLDRAGPRPGQ